MKRMFYLSALVLFLGCGTGYPEAKLYSNGKPIKIKDVVNELGPPSFEMIPGANHGMRLVAGDQAGTLSPDYARLQIEWLGRRFGDATKGYLIAK